MNQLSSRKFELHIENILDQQSPLKELGEIASSEILLYEFCCRSALLLTRTARVAVRALDFLFSSLLVLFSFSSHIDFQPLLYQLRHLAADLFEFIGVILCSISLLPFNRDSSPNILHAQVWIEQTADYISGDDILIEASRQIVADAQRNLALLTKAKEFIELDSLDNDNWRQLELQISHDLSQIDLLDHRRIARPQLTLETHSINKKLQELYEILSSQMGDYIIPLLEWKLQRMNLEVVIEPRPPSLDYFETLLTETQNQVNQLHAIHDSENQIKDALEDLQKEFNAALEHHISTGHPSNTWRQIVEHYYSDIRNRLTQIEKNYNYEDVNELPIDILDKIQDCHAQLQEKRNSFPKPEPMDRQTALDILKLKDGADASEITAAYQSLRQRHHPDRGGSLEDYRAIFEAYQVLK